MKKEVSQRQVIQTQPLNPITFQDSVKLKYSKVVVLLTSFGFALDLRWGNKI